MSTFHGELCGIKSALQTFERFIIGSPHPIKFFVITSHRCACSHETEGCPTDASATKWLLRSSLLYKSFEHLEKILFFLNFWLKIFPWRTLMARSWFMKKILKITDSSKKTDMKFNNSLTVTALLVMEMTILSHCFIWMKQRRFTLKMMILKNLYNFRLEVT